MPVSISKLPEITNIKDDSFIMLTQDGKTKRTLCNQFVTEEEARLDEFSPVITTSKSMTSVGQGDNGDYSSSIHEGAFKDCMLHGRTLVNYNQEGHNRNEYVVPSAHEGQHITATNTIEGHVKSAILKGMTLVNLPSTTNPGITQANFAQSLTPEGVSMLKPSTKYLLKIFNHSSEDKKYTTHPTLFVQQKTPVLASSTATYIIQTNADVSRGECLLRNETNHELANHLDTLLIEYQEGVENWDIPYFEGMTSVKMPVLTTHNNGNLFDKNTVDRGYFTSLGNFVSNNSYVVSDYIEIKNNRVLTSSSKISPDPNFMYTCYDSNKTFIERVLSRKSVTLSDNVKYVRISVRLIENFTDDEIDVITNFGTTATNSEPFKSNILTVNEEVELRGIGEGSNRVEDELNLLTGEVVERIGEINTASMNESYFTGYALEPSGLYRMTINIENLNINGSIKCDKLPVVPFMDSWDLPYECITIYSGGILLYLKDTPNIESYVNKATGLDLIIQYGKVQNSVKTVVLSDNVVYSYDEVTHYDCSSEEGSLVPTLSIKNEVSYKAIIKPSTKYSVVFNRTKIGESLRVNLGGAEVGAPTSVVGKNIVSVTTPSTLSHELVKFIGTGNFIKDVQVIEGDIAGDEPYFEGMIDCKSPILSNCGKNLFDISGEVNEKFSNMSVSNNPNTVDENTIIASSWTNGHHGKGQKIKVKRGKLYTCSFTTSDNGSVIIHTPNKVNFTSVKSSTFAFTAPTDCDEIIVAFNTYGASSGGKIHNLCVVEGDVTSVEYEPYKSNTITFDQKDGKTIVLRSLPNGTCDTLNVETGEYVQRIGEVVYNGSENEGWEAHSTTYFDNLLRWQINLTKLATQTNNREKTMTCDKVRVVDYINFNVKNHEFVSIHESGDSLHLMLEKTRATTMEQLNQYLNTNPLTIQYELATPIITKVDVQGFPYAYKDGHVQLSSGSIEQSLTPKVEYNIATNRGGQITQNTKSLIRQGKLLDDIEGKINQIIEATINDSIMLMKLRNK